MHIIVSQSIYKYHILYRLFGQVKEKKLSSFLKEEEERKRERGEKLRKNYL